MKDYENRHGVRNTAGFEALTTLGANGRDSAVSLQQTVLSDVHETCSQTASLVARVMDLADRLCGPFPHQDGVGVGPKADGELGRARATMRDTREALADATEALNRIERELIG